MFHLSREPMALLGLDARFWDVNQALADTVQLQPQQLCCGISLLSLVVPEDLDTFLHHARSLLGANEGAEPCHVKFPCRMRSNDDSIIDIEFDLHMLRRSSSPYCFALYLRHKPVKSEPAPPQAAALDAGALSMNPGMFLLGQLQQQQQLATSSGAQFMMGGLQQQEHAGNMFGLGDFQQQSSMFMPPSAGDAGSPHSGAFS